MILGVGTDILEIRRMQDLLKRQSIFLKRHFTIEEQNYFDRWKNPVASIAVSFCGKEAVAKAMGTGISGFSLVEIEILHTQKGQPFVVLHGRAQEIASNLGIEKWHLSLSHSDHYAMATCIAEK